MFLMKSTTSGASLCFSERSAEYFNVTIETPNLTATKKVCIYDYASSNSFVDFFQRIALNTRPWAGEDVWETLEGEMRLRATCDALGHVRFEITLRDYSLDWSLVCSMLFDFGMLPQHAADAGRFMAQ
ncbi:DUF6228 family protein [Paracoccus aminovorans]|uniref:DUF6228 family protein n=1 Tax=Paracoccus aminovorans TaxID=34004 RepID=UPI00396F33D0